MSKLIRAICKLEGKKSQTSVGNVREVVACLVKCVAIDKDLRHEFLDKIAKCHKNRFDIGMIFIVNNKHLKRLQKTKKKKPKKKGKK